jgi:hypothetical protein
MSEGIDANQGLAWPPDIRYPGVTVNINRAHFFRIVLIIIDKAEVGEVGGICA